MQAGSWTRRNAPEGAARVKFGGVLDTYDAYYYDSNTVLVTRERRSV